MTRDAQRLFAPAVAVMAGLVVLAGVVILLADYLAARAHAPKDDERIAALQEQAQTDSSFALELAELHEQITATRSATKARRNQISILLIVAASAFIASAKWLMAMRGLQPMAMSKLVRIEARPKPTAAVTRRPPAEPPSEAPAGTRRSPAEPPSEAPAADQIDLAFVDEIVEREGRGPEAAIPILQAIQSHYGYLPDEALKRVCELTEVTPAQIAGTSSFYAQFRRSPAGKHTIRVCHGTACHVSGARQITEELRRHLRIPEGEDTDPERMFTLDEVACLGCCSLAPVLMVDDHTAGKLTPASACEALDIVEQKEPA